MFLRIVGDTQSNAKSKCIDVSVSVSTISDLRSMVMTQINFD